MNDLLTTSYSLPLSMFNSENICKLFQYISYIPRTYTVVYINYFLNETGKLTADFCLAPVQRREAFLH